MGIIVVTRQERGILVPDDVWRRPRPATSPRTVGSGGTSRRLARSALWRFAVARAKTQAGHYLRMASSRSEVTQLLQQWSEGRQDALDRLVPQIYAELRRLASSYLRRERPDHTLQATALVHEAFLRLVDQRAVRWQNRANFFGIAAQAMRRILVDHARAHAAGKRGAGQRRISLDEVFVSTRSQDIDLLALDEVLTRLATIDPQQSRLVELRFFGGLTMEETAEVLNISPATVGREWTLAKAWLYAELQRAPRS
jgi:RNA polymerase sigma factor (TIGR02999 family)